MKIKDIRRILVGGAGSMGQQIGLQCATHTATRSSGSGRWTIMESSLLQQIALLASAVIAAATVATLLWGIWMYKRNGEAQVQLLALGTLQHYLDLAIAHPELASREDGQPVDAQYSWFAAHALNTTQTLLTLVGHRVEWQRSINAIVRQHRSYLRSGLFVCSDFSPEFVSYLREAVADVRCAESSDTK